MYKIYLYIQSQFLVRSAFGFAFNHKEIKQFIRTQIPEAIVKLKVERQHIQNLLNQSSVTEVQVQDRQIKLLRVSKNNEQLSSLRNFSMNCTTRIRALANECSSLNTVVYNISEDALDLDLPKHKQDLIDLIVPIQKIEDSIALCQDDYKRLVLSYHKFLQNKYNISNNVNGFDAEKTFDSATEATKVVNFNDATDSVKEEDEFYTLLERNDEDEPDKGVLKTSQSLDDELKQLDKNIIQKRFKPVLEQLKDKIGPIKRSMQERERKYLEAKGIYLKDDDFTDDYEQKINLLKSDKGNGSDSDDSDFVPLIKNSQRYDDVRKFLQEKQQISLFPPMHLPPTAALQEDILE